MHVAGGYDGRALDLVETLDLDAAEWLAEVRTLLALLEPS